MAVFKEFIRVPSELRQLVFRPHEVTRAVRALYRRRSEPVPAGNVMAVTPELDETGEIAGVRLALTPEPVVEWMEPACDAADRREIHVEAPALAAALIMECREQRIPLPAKSKKSLRLVGGRVCLVVAVERD
jgi:hypothetical protein